MAGRVPATHALAVVRPPRRSHRPGADGRDTPGDGFEPLAVKVEDKRQNAPWLHNLPSLQKLCAARFGWSAAKTPEIARALYDGQGKKTITYHRAETRYRPKSLISDVPLIVAGLQVGRTFSQIPVPTPPVVRKGASGTFRDKETAIMI